jgi:hypothetical protein
MSLPLFLTGLGWGNTMQDIQHPAHLSFKPDDVHSLNHCQLVWCTHHSFFSSLQKEQSNHGAYHLFMTLTHNLSNHYPSFKIALGRVMKDNASLQVDYKTLFQSLILDHL